MSKIEPINIPLKYPIESNPSVLGGAPIIKGTRIPASLVLELFRRGYSVQILKQEYPSLTERKLTAFLTLMSDSFDGYPQKTV